MESGRGQFFCRSRRIDRDVVVVDIEMPVLNGLDAVKQITESGSKAKVVILTVNEDPDMVRLCFEAGAVAFVIKSRLA